MRPDYGPHFLVATEVEGAIGAQSIQLDGVNAFAAYEGVAYGLGPECLAQLHSLVIGQCFDINVLDRYEEVFVWDEMHGPWLIRLPDDFVGALAAFDDKSIGSLASKWVETCYAFQANEVPLDWAERIVSRLVALARRAVQDGKKLYWEAPSC